MSTSSILGGERAAARARGRDADSLGPSDSSDSGSDIQGERVMPTAPDAADEWGALPVNAGADSDASGTGERGSATGDDPESGADILPDRVLDEGGPEGELDLSADDVAAEDAISDLADDQALDDEDSAPQPPVSRSK